MTNVEPVHVHLASVGAGVSMAAPQPRPRKFCPVVPNTIQLSAANPVQLLCARDSSRTHVIVKALSGGGTNGNIIVCRTKADAVNATETGPEGFGAVIEIGNTVPTVIPTNDELWVGTLAAPSQVSVFLVSETTAED